jgi:hypothetical protein
MESHNLSVYFDEDEPNEKLNHSIFLVSINSNKVMTKTSTEGKRFRTEVSQVLNNISDYIAQTQGYNDPEMMIRVKAFTEQGTKQHRLHIHAIIDISHNSHIRIDTDKISRKLGGMYVNSRYIKGSGDIERVMKYIRKQQ